MGENGVNSVVIINTFSCGIKLFSVIRSKRCFFKKAAKCVGIAYKR